MFFGEFLHSLDSKGRVIIPSRFREAATSEGAGEGYYLAWGLGNCVYMYTPAKWEGVVKHMKQGAFAKKKLRDFTRMFFSSAGFVVPDSQGRILVPEKLRVLAGLKKDIAFVGVQDHIEIWDIETWRVLENVTRPEYEKTVEEIPEILLDE